MKLNEFLDGLCRDIICICVPQKILLFSYKQSPDGELHSVKLCVIIGDGDSRMIERKLYVEVDSVLSFDILVYTEAEWSQLLENNMSFASRIQKTGRVLYKAD